eukprot:7182442-Prorocentrum_lima.AAC.1
MSPGFPHGTVAQRAHGVRAPLKEEEPSRVRLVVGLLVVLVAVVAGPSMSSQEATIPMAGMVEQLR